MKLRNKKTGEIIQVIFEMCEGNVKVVNKIEPEKYGEYSSLEEIRKEWEDYEEDKICWYIDVDGEIKSKELGWFNQAQDNIGNRFESKEEAEETVEKLKVWKRLKDAGFMFKGWGWEGGLGNYAILGTKDRDCLPDEIEFNRSKDLDLLFGGKE